MFRLLDNGTTKGSSWEDQGRALSLWRILRYTNPHTAKTLYAGYTSTFRKSSHLINSNQQIKWSDIPPLNRIQGCEMLDEERTEEQWIFSKA